VRTRRWDAGRLERSEPLRRAGALTSRAQRAGGGAGRRLLRAWIDFPIGARLQSPRGARRAARNRGLVSGWPRVRRPRLERGARDRSLARRARTGAALRLGAASRARGGKGQPPRSAPGCWTGDLVWLP